MSGLIFAVAGGLFMLIAIVVAVKRAATNGNAVWEPNRRAINGVFRKGVSGVTGMDGGIPVSASVEVKQEVNNDVTSIDENDSPTTFTAYVYTLSLSFPPAGHEDWFISFSGKGSFNRKENPRWRVSSADHALVERLERTGVLAAFDRTWPKDTTVAYEAKQGKMTMRYVVYDQKYSPSGSLFRKQLNLMKAFAALNAAAASAAA